MTQAANLATVGSNANSSGVLTIASLYGQNSNLVTTPYSDTGLIPGELIYRLNTAYVGSSSASAQSVFGVGVTLASSTVYQFEAYYAISKTVGNTSHLFGIGFGGTATLNNISYFVIGRQQASGFNAAAAPDTCQVNQSAANNNLWNSAWTQAAEQICLILRGAVSINAGGTFIPQYTSSAAVGPFTTAIGSWIKLSPLNASGANTNIGGWA